MKIAILDTYYPGFLDTHYRAQPGLGSASYVAQRDALMAQAFGTADFYSRHLRAAGHEVQDLVVNCATLQMAWAREAGHRVSAWSMNIPPRLLRAPVVGPWLCSLSGLIGIAVAQIRAQRPDVLYCQDLWFLPPAILADLKSSVGLIVGQTASPLPPAEYLKPYDLITTSFPHFVPRLRSRGIAAEYFRIGFDESVLERLGPVAQDIPVSFVGGISRHHGKALPLLDHLAAATPIEFFGYGAERLPETSPIRTRHRGEVWGLDMYRALARSRITLNRHIDVAENNANNMRLYEATGVGALLVTDRKDNLGELFEPGREVVAYGSAEEAVELIRHYLDHPEEARRIALAGQARTLAQHTYRQRMKELEPMLERHLAARRRGRAA